MKINTTYWKEFLIGELFDIHPTKHYNDENGKALSNAKLFNVDGINPVIVNSSYNNGVGGYTNKPCTEKGGIITFSDTTTANAIFYQANDFVGYSHVQGMYPTKYKDNWDIYSMKFFESVFRSRAKCLGYDYVNKFTRELASAIVIKLPVDSFGNPDFQYMKDYMKCVKGLAENKLNRMLKENKLTKTNLVDISTWKDYNISDLFRLSLPNGDLQIKKIIEGDVPLITPSNTNNGLFTFISKESKSTLYKKGSITVDMFGNAYYHDYDFFVTAHGHVNVLIPKNELNRFSALFICSSIKSMFLQKYGFSDMCTQTVLKKSIIRLPTDKYDEPDYEYMEKYMRQVEKKVSTSLDQIQSAIY